MLSEEQLTHLESVIHRLDEALHLEEAALEAEQTLRLVLCNDSICFQPVRVTAPDVDIPAVLAGQPAAQQALLHHLRSALQGLV